VRSQTRERLFKDRPSKLAQVASIHCAPGASTA